MRGGPPSFPECLSATSVALDGFGHRCGGAGCPRKLDLGRTSRLHSPCGGILALKTRGHCNCVLSFLCSLTHFLTWGPHTPIAPVDHLVLCVYFTHMGMKQGSLVVKPVGVGQSWL